MSHGHAHHGHAHGPGRARSRWLCAIRRPRTRAAGGAADRRLHDRRGGRRRAHGLAGADRRCRAHADRRHRAGAGLARLPALRAAGQLADDLRLRPHQDPGRLYERPDGAADRAVDRDRGGDADARAGAGAGRSDARHRGGGARGQRRRLLHPERRRPGIAQPARARSCMCSATCSARWRRSSRR